MVIYLTKKRASGIYARSLISAHLELTSRIELKAVDNSIFPVAEVYYKIKYFFENDL